MPASLWSLFNEALFRDDFKKLIRSGIEEELDKEEILCRLFEATAPLPQPAAQGRRLFTVGESLELLRLVQEKGPQWVEIGRELGRSEHACQVHHRYLKLGRVRVAPLFAGHWTSEELWRLYGESFSLLR